ncbi:MAG TPA: transporter substrate-binding domain-containing protein [Rectinemataceae bacterium]|nr:transporter substrate-binding domain-containing protein [Rectinemataceae bacterium]
MEAGLNLGRRPHALAALILVLLATARLGADVNTGAIRVTLDANYPPYCFRDEKGVPQGILVDQWKLWEERTGIPVQLMALDWSQAQAAMAEGRADVIDTIFSTPERAKLYDFTPPYATIEVPVFFDRDLSGFGSISGLRGFTVGVKAGDAAIDVLKSRGIADLRIYPNYESIVRAAVAGEIHVFSIDKPPALYYLYKLGVQARFRSSISLYTGQFRRAVPKGDNARYAQIMRGFAMITKQEYAAIDLKWLGLGLELPQYLRMVLLSLLGGAGLALILAVWIFLLRRLVRTRTSELSAAVEELTRANQAADRARVEAERASLVKGQFLSNMSHEIRTPLNGIIGMASLLEASPLSGEQTEYLAMMKVSARLLLNIVNDILDLAKIESGMRNLRPEPVALEELARSILLSFGPEAEEKGIALSYEAGPGLPGRAIVDGTALSQVAINLVGNAVKFTDSGRVVLSLSCRAAEGAGTELILKVEDTGIGIPEDRLAEVFERFSQLEEPMTKKRGGTGLGLAIVRELVALMGGRVSATSALGRGSAFTVSLPVVPVAAEAGPASDSAGARAAEDSAAAASEGRSVLAAQAEAGPGSRPAAPGGGPKQRLGAGRRILVVEDNQINLLYLKAVLLREGYAVELASNGREAVEKAAAARFALILMDIQMPEMDGIEALARIRASGGLSLSTTVLALTGYAMEEDQRLLLERGFAAVVTKPIRERQLLRLVDEAAGRDGAAAP